MHGNALPGTGQHGSALGSMTPHDSLVSLTCRRVFISMKKNSSVSVSMINSTVPAFR